LALRHGLRRLQGRWRHGPDRTRRHGTARRKLGDPGRGGHRGTKAHRVLGVRVHRDPDAQLGREQFAHKGNPARPTYQQHGVQVGRVDAGPAHHLAEHADRADHLRVDHVLELAPGDQHLLAHPGQHHRNDRVQVGRECLLRLNNRSEELAERAGAGRVLHDHVHVHPCRKADMTEQCMIEIDAANPKS
jgi:hypothetical protein